MAQKVKIDNAVLKRRRRKAAKERVAIRAVRTFILVVCEGERTEPNYFNALRDALPKNVLETTRIDVVGTGANTLSVVERAQEEERRAGEIRNRKFDQVWVVIDRDSFPAGNFNNAIFKCQGLTNYHCAWSNEAFELWYVLHFQYRNTAMGRDEYATVITDEIRRRISEAEAPSVKCFTYEKNDERMYALLQEFGNQDIAIRNADKLLKNFSDTRFANHNPCTTVHQLVLAINALRDTE